MHRALASAALLLVACGKGVDLDDSGGPALPAGCDDGAPPDTYVQGIERQTRDGAATIALASADPAPPDVGVNRWTVDASIAPGSVLRVRPWMPLHGHGTSPEWHTATEEAGAWVFDGVDLFMPGLWELVFTVDSTDKDGGALFRFCLEG